MVSAAAKAGKRQQAGRGEGCAAALSAWRRFMEGFLRV